MRLWVLLLSVLFFIPHISLAVTFMSINNVVNEPSEVQEFHEVKLFKNCQYFLKTSLANDNFFTLIQNDNDDGYTHGHLTSINKNCDSGRDINVALDSRLFTEVLWYYESPANDDKVIILHRFEEENRVNIEYTDWRDFSKMYQTVGLTIGTLSRDKMRLAGVEQDMFHAMFGSVTLEDLGIYKKRPVSITDSELTTDQASNENSELTRLYYIPDYDYQYEDENRKFIGGHIAFGKSYSLDGLKKICDKQCIDYFRAEAGMEIISLEKGSNVYVFSEIGKRMPHPLEALSVFASLKFQKNEGVDSTYRESSFGLRFRASMFQLHYVIKKRNLPDGGNPLIPYDNDEDDIAFFGIQIPLEF